jgi:anti-anti-sigma regulatory factor
MRGARIALDCGSVSAPTASAVDQIARLQLTARRCGCRLELTNSSPSLLELIDFCGLAEVLRVETKRQAEERKQLRGVEEERELDDPPRLELEHL